MSELEASSVPPPVLHDRQDPGPALGDILPKDVMNAIGNPENANPDRSTPSLLDETKNANDSTQSSPFSMEGLKAFKTRLAQRPWTTVGVMVGVGLLVGAKLLKSTLQDSPKASRKLFGWAR